MNYGRNVTRAKVRDETVAEVKKLRSERDIDAELLMEREKTSYHN